ncbi:glycosyltransferase family 2 protein [Pseudoalteromonas distincta]|uniref:glycosyltransferase family 2 protein n=1 Tax=Pseudoalteromonas distincta TaxID=77608 RepID=UPI00020A0261|nr:glycosyltransferase [Pseudoalteromonas distincta]EGI74696.1 glycosyl transferase domain protein [Pseudoalteromonas distincta]
MSISIILPVYNAEQYLDEAIQSILVQSHKQFELICVDDGSTDGSLKIIQKYARADARVVIISRENKGLIYSLNEAINMCKYRYIARMDADDICEPERLELQIKAMKSKKLAVIGSSYSYIDTTGVKTGSRLLPTGHRIISWLMDFGSPFCHPSVMFDKELIGTELRYDPNYKHCEDYELWFRCRRIGLKLGNLNKLAFNYRVLETSVSRLNNQEQRLTSINLVAKYCDFVENKDEAEYILYGRKHTKNLKMINKFLLRSLRQFNLAKAFFVFLYLIK